MTLAASVTMTWSTRMREVLDFDKGSAADKLGPELRIIKGAKTKRHSRSIERQL